MSKHTKSSYIFFSVIFHNKLHISLLDILLKTDNFFPEFMISFLTTVSMYMNLETSYYQHHKKVRSNRKCEFVFSKKKNK